VHLDRWHGDVQRHQRGRPHDADAHETIVCAWLSFTTLLGLALNAVFGWWWADPVAALAMVPLIVREGLEAWRAEPLLKA
jgi:divalent metal cation (Fe/Co/Zn/Cd) transporter